MKQEMKRGASVFGEVVGFVISIFVVTTIFPRLPFVTSSYSLWLPIAIGTSLTSSILKIVKHIVDQRFSHFFHALSLLPDLYSTYMLVLIFPLDFSLVGYMWLNSVIKLCLSVAIFGIIVGCIVDLVKFGKAVCK